MWLWLLFWWWCGRDINDDVFFHIAASVHPITVAEHLGVRLPASPPPRALDDQQLLAVEGLGLDVRVDGGRKMPHFC